MIKSSLKATSTLCKAKENLRNCVTLVDGFLIYHQYIRNFFTVNAYGLSKHGSKILTQKLKPHLEFET